REDMFEKLDGEGLRGGITWLVPNAQKNLMEPILLTLGPGGRTDEFPAHSGEEFGYVLSGRAVLAAGDARYTLRRGESFCLHPDAPHHIENPGPGTARLIWASAPPSF
ncbi:MAG TPA: cupin domain-containing protein, partial [Candidatus Limnocylindria bacterium]|nr:cupin domain-containing protein [Candidatus Limnocylindria bacterium]